MAKLAQLIDTLAATWGVPRTAVESYAKPLRKAGKIASAGRSGPGSPDMDESDVANLITGFMAGSTEQVVDRVDFYGSLMSRINPKSDSAKAIEIFCDRIGVQLTHSFRDMLMSCIALQRRSKEMAGRGALALRLGMLDVCLRDIARLSEHPASGGTEGVTARTIALRDRKTIGGLSIGINTSFPDAWVSINVIDYISGDAIVSNRIRYTRDVLGQIQSTEHDAKLDARDVFGTVRSTEQKTKLGSYNFIIKPDDFSYGLCGLPEELSEEEIEAAATIEKERSLFGDMSNDLVRYNQISRRTIAVVANILGETEVVPNESTSTDAKPPTLNWFRTLEP